MPPEPEREGEPTTASTLPRQIGPYQVLALLGQGTMSRVYRASLPLLGHQEYAVKLLRERCKPAEVSAYLGECAKVKRLGTHPHLVPLYFAGRDRRLGRYYVAMELVRGPTAAQVQAEAPAHQLPVARAARIALQVALGLEHAHRRGILHLDVKPSNILLEAEGDLARLTDFGSAQLQEETPTRARHTRPGSPAYRAWELTPAGARAGLAPDGRSDVYGLAATLYHLLTGQVPQWTADGHVHSPTRWRRDLPSALEALLLGALSRDPDQRPPTMEAFRRALEACVTTPRASFTGLVPISTTRLVGRTDLLQTIKDRLLSGETLALSALGGLPGVGKTALAAAIANDPEVLAHFTGGILWAGLGKTPDLQAVLGVWGAALGITREELAALRELEAWSQAIRARIGERRMLLVLDDVWTMEAALACRVGGPAAAHLLTTRSAALALQFAGKGLVAVPELAEREGMTLLGQLAPQVVADQPEEARALVHAVGGLPLGLILLGKHLQLHSYGGQPRRIRAALDRLGREGELLRLEQLQPPAAPHPSLPAGTSLSLSASIGLSEAALGAPAQAMLRALAVFPPKPASFSEEAALAVSAGTPDALDQLVDAGLLDPAGAGRYTLHQTIADYARAQGVPQDARRRFVTWAAARIEAHQDGDPALEEELSSLLEALRLPLAAEDQTLQLQGSLSLAPFLLARGLYGAASDLLGHAQATARARSDARGVMAAWLQLGRLAVLRGEYERAVTCYREGISLARQLEAVPELTSLLQSLGFVLQNQGHLDQAQAALEEGLALANQEAQPGTRAAILINLGAVAARRGEHEQAAAYYQSGFELAQACHDAVRTTAALQGLAHVAIRRGYYPQAQDYLRQGVDLARRLGHRARLSTLLCSLGALAVGLGQFEQAKDTLGESLQLAREVGHREGMCIALSNLAEALFRLGQESEAEAALEEGLAVARQMGHYEYLCSLLALQGEVALQRGFVAEAEVPLREGELQARTSGHRWHLSRILSARGQVDLETERLEAAGQALTEALDLAQTLKSPELEAASRYGLARLALAEGRLEEAYQQGQQSASLYVAQGLYPAAEVKRWLASLPLSAVGRPPEGEQAT